MQWSGPAKAVSHIDYRIAKPRRRRASLPEVCGTSPRQIGECSRQRRCAGLAITASRCAAPLRCTRCREMCQRGRARTRRSCRRRGDPDPPKVGGMSWPLWPAYWFSTDERFSERRVMGGRDAGVGLWSLSRKFRLGSSEQGFQGRSGTGTVGNSDRFDWGAYRGCVWLQPTAHRLIAVRRFISQPQSPASSQARRFRQAPVDPPDTLRGARGCSGRSSAGRAETGDTAVEKQGCDEKIS